MLAAIQITPWHWPPSSRASAFLWGLTWGVSPPRPRGELQGGAWLDHAWFALAMFFAGALVPLADANPPCSFSPVTSLSFRCRWTTCLSSPLIFGHFGVPSAYPAPDFVLGHSWRVAHARCPHWRGSGAHAWLHWVLYLLGGLLVFSGFKMMVVGTRGWTRQKNRVVRLGAAPLPGRAGL